MEHFSVAVTSIGELERYLNLERLRKHEADARSMLIQIYSSSCDPQWLAQVVGAIKCFSTKAVIAGATTVGEISEGRIKIGTTVVSLSFFALTRLVRFAQPVAAGHEEAATEALSGMLANMEEPVTAVLLLATPLSMDCNIMLRTLHGRHPGLALFGGGAGDYAGMARTFVFDNEQRLEAGMVAVVMIGSELFVDRYAFLGWKTVGKQMKITKSDGFTVHEIDGAPAFRVYERYLGVKADNDFFLNALEFPLLLLRGDQVLARVPVSANADGSITFIADINQGEFVQLGYGDIMLILEEAASLQARVREFMPQAIFTYSCGCRRFLMQEDIELELAPLEAVAPTAGFFTYGEFCDLGEQSPLLNSTIVVVALREGAKRAVPASAATVEQQPESLHQASDPYYRKHSRVLSRFLYYLDSVTQELTVSSQHKSHFLSNMSHELRTPLNAIIGYTEIVMQELQDNGGFESSVADLRRVLHSSNHLLSLVSDVLDFTRIEAGKTRLNFGPTELTELLFSAAKMVTPLMVQNNNQFVVDNRYSGLKLNADHEKILRILMHLLRNAAKFTLDGKVTLQVLCTEKDIEFHVIDTGIGIAPEHLESIFEEFNQADDRSTRKYGGAGLGLSISRGWANLMGGAVTVKSELGAGSTFALRLPLSVTETG